MAADGETNEETLLQESANKEAYYMGRLLDLQSELKHNRATVANAQADNEHLSALLQELREVGEENGVWKNSGAEANGGGTRRLHT